MSNSTLSAMGHVIESIGVDLDSQNKCYSCKLLVVDKFVFRVDGRTFHQQCIKCSFCDLPLEEKCYFKNGKVLCSEHYFKDNAVHQCAGCKNGISPSDMVYKLRAGLIFHVACHCCATCGRGLTPGEQILVDEASKSVSCLMHYQTDQVEAPCELPACSSNEYQQMPQDPITDFSIKKELQDAEAYTYGFENYSYSEYCDDDSKMMKRRGPRTTIKQSQLDVLNEMFTNTPKPSKHARAKLALETGLSMRVIQVWFQNRRSKERRLKHLCNYLRHYEQRGMGPPHFHPESVALGPEVDFNFPPNFDDEEDDE